MSQNKTKNQTKQNTANKTQKQTGHPKGVKHYAFRNFPMPLSTAPQRNSKYPKTSHITQILTSCFICPDDSMMKIKEAPSIPLRSLLTQPASKLSVNVLLGSSVRSIARQRQQRPADVILLVIQGDDKECHFW